MATRHDAHYEVLVTHVVSTCKEDRHGAALSDMQENAHGETGRKTVNLQSHLSYMYKPTDAYLPRAIFALSIFMSRGLSSLMPFFLSSGRIPLARRGLLHAACLAALRERRRLWPSWLSLYATTWLTP